MSLKDYEGQEIVFWGYYSHIEVINNDKKMLYIEKAKIWNTIIAKNVRVEYIEELKKIHIYPDDYLCIVGTVAFNSYINDYEIINTKSITVRAKKSKYWDNPKAFIEDHSTYRFRLRNIEIKDRYLIERYNFKTIEDINEEDISVYGSKRITLYLKEITENFELKFYYTRDDLPFLFGKAFINVLTAPYIVLDKKYIFTLPGSVINNMRELVVDSLCFNPNISIPYCIPFNEKKMKLDKDNKEYFVYNADGKFLIDAETIKFRYELFYHPKSFFSSLSDEEVLKLFKENDYLQTKAYRKFFCPIAPNYNDYDFLRKLISGMCMGMEKPLKMKLFDYCCKIKSER